MPAETWACTWSICRRRFRISKFGTSSDRDRAWVLRQIATLVPRALDEGLEVCVGGEDSSRADVDFLLRVIEAAEAAGARRFRFADTVGILEPFRTHAVLSRLRQRHRT